MAQDTNVLAPASLGALDFPWVVEQLKTDASVDVGQVLTPRSLRAMANGSSVTDLVVSATMPDDVAAELETHPQLIVEEDTLVQPHDPPTPLPAPPDPGVLTPFGASPTWTLRVVDPAGRPLANALVMLYGSARSTQGKTDADGRVQLTLLNESDASLAAVFVNPESGCWSLWADRPAFTQAQVNTVTCEALAASPGAFPDSESLGWGQRAMRLDQVPPQFSGRGVTVAVVDSGAAVLTHPDLSAVHEGMDLTTVPANPDQWRDDQIAHGSHCSGIIAGARGGGGIRGFAPDATVMEARIFPGGRVSSLVDALDFCIDQQVDVVNMSLGTGGSSQILLQKITQAREMGVACIVAAGNTGGPVQFPGTSPDVLTVAAMGVEGSFPETSYHARQRWTAGQHDGQYFSAQFSCHGPEVDVCAPGVAIVSSVPAAGYASWDGTSMATPHVTGLAALVLAHHPDFQSGPLTARTSARVDRLFEILKGSATPLTFGDPQRSGSGLPDAPRALGLVPGAAPATRVDPGAAITVALAQLTQSMVASGLIAAPASVEPPVLDPARQITRGLAELGARLRNAGILSP